MNKERIAAIAARGEQIKTNSAQYLWICCGIRPPLLPNKPVDIDPNVNPDDLHLRLRSLNRPTPATRQRP